MSDCATCSCASLVCFASWSCSALIGDEVSVSLCKFFFTSVVSIALMMGLLRGSTAASIPEVATDMVVTSRSLRVLIVNTFLT